MKKLEWLIAWLSRRAKSLFVSLIGIFSMLECFHRRVRADHRPCRR